MKILVYGNRKQPNVYWDASNAEKETAALRQLFEMLKDDWEVYTDLDDPQSPDEKKERAWYDAACSGDDVALLKLLRARKSAEYEEWYFDKVTDPLKKEA